MNRATQWVTGAMLSVVCFCTSVEGQTGWEDLPHNTITTDEFATILGAVDLRDDDQRALLNSMVQDYQRACADAAEEFITASQPLLNDLRNTFDSQAIIAALDTIQSHASDWQAAQIAAEHTLESDVSLMLNEQQSLAWQTGLRAFRRQKHLHNIREHWRKRHAVDLVECFKTVSDSVVVAEAASPILTAYELAIDQLLREYHRESWMASVVQRKLWGVQHLPPADQITFSNDWQSSYHRVYALVEKVVDAQWTHMSAISDALPGEVRSQFRAEVQRRVYHELFWQGPVELAHEALLEYEGILPDQRQIISQIVSTHMAADERLRSEIMNANDRWLHPTLARERSATFRQWFGDSDLPHEERWRLKSELEQQHPANDLLIKRYNLSADTCRQLRAVVTDVQFADAPLRLQLLLER